MHASSFRNAAFVGLCCLLPGFSLPFGAAAPAPIEAESFDLRDVRLLDGPFKQAMELNSRYLLSLEPDRFLCYFRTGAGLKPKAQAYGGWEAPNSGAGRCLGHYLSALSLQFRASGDARFKNRIDYIVDELALCHQDNGLLTAQAGVKAAFTELAKGKGDALRKSRVPWYVEHKLFAGLRDAFLLTGNEKAKNVLIQMSDWAVSVTRELNEPQFQIMLEQEHGGMREVLGDVYAMTGNTNYLNLANKFSHYKIMAPLMAGKDELNGLHANTQIPKLVGSARIYELTSDTKEKDAAAFFWDSVVHHHSYAIGGDSDDEHFGPPDRLAHGLSPATCETCNVYNMLKLTRHLFSWKPEVQYADFYERALYNQILASQEPGTGMFTYFLSLKPGHFRTYSTPEDSFWCCVGTGMENHAQYGNSIYFHRGDNLFINLFIPSELRWQDKHVVLKQETKYPESNGVTFTMACPEPVWFTFNLRYPGWASPGMEIKVNGEAVAAAAKPGTFVPVRREWHQGDRIEVKIPMSPRMEALPDDPNKIAIFYGPLVLGGQLGTGGMPESLEARDQNKFRKVPDPEVPSLAASHKPIELWLKPVPGQSLAFRTFGVGRPREVTLVPFYRECHERYTAYWQILNKEEPEKK